MKSKTLNLMINTTIMSRKKMKEKAKKVSKEPQAQLDSSLKKETQNLAKAQREPSLKR